MVSHMLFGCGWYSALSMLLFSESRDMTTDPGPAHPAFLGGDVSLTRQLASAKDDECGTDQELQP
jgi:hypothetical protein